MKWIETITPKQAAEELDGLNVLVNNAGRTRMQSILDLTP